MTDSRRFIGEILIDMGRALSRDVEQALEHQMNGDPRRIGEILVDRRVCTAEDVSCALAEQHDLPLVDLHNMDLNPSATALMDANRCAEFGVIPVDIIDGTVILALSDPVDVYALDSVQFLIDAPVEPVVATRPAIHEAIERIYGARQSMSDPAAFGRELEPGLTFVDPDARRKAAEIVRKEDDTTPILQLINLLVQQAVKNRASDIHIEPMVDRLRVRYRIDGVCYELPEQSRRIQGAVISSIKNLAELRLEEKRRPQDGKIVLKTLNRRLDLRVSALPSTHGESVVLRILDRKAVDFDLEALGLHSTDLGIWRELIRKPNGIILITGPTGSGKTTTLYGALNELNQPDRKIITVENPVEYTVNGLNQCQVNEDAGLTFHRALRAILRQAPNIILIGEIRDKETAEIAIQAALTGHLVFSTLHTNDAPSAPVRLIDMKIAPYLVGSSLQAVTAQRLVRLICPDCKAPYHEDAARLRDLGLAEDQYIGKTFYHGTGTDCGNCNNIGYRGRKGIFEIMVMDGRLREMCSKGATVDALRNQARRDGMRTLLEDGIRKILDGWTTLDEVLGVAKRHFQRDRTDVA